MAQAITNRITSKGMFERLGVGSFGSYYNCRLLRWANYIVRMPLDRMPRKHLTSCVEHARLISCPQINRGCTLKEAIKSYDFGQWSALAAGRRV